MDKGSGFALVPIFVIVFLACAAQAAAPVSPPESRFVWEPGENQTFTWTTANFDGFYYDAQSRAGKESLTIMLDNIKDRSIPKDGIVYSTTVETVTARYSPFGEYSVIGLLGEKYLAGYPEGKSNITVKSGINLNQLHSILIDDDASYSLTMGSNLTLSEGYVLEITEVNITGASVILSLKKDEIKVDTGTRKVEAGKNYIYKAQGLPIIAVHIDSVFQGKENASVTINGIFQVSQYETLVRKGDNPFGVMWVTNISDNGITMKNAAGIVELKPGQIIDIGEINMGELKLKVADSNTLRIHLYQYWLNEKSEHRGATGSNNLAAWDGLNYAGFLYDADSGNYSELLAITNLTGRKIPEGGLTYTSYRLRKVPYAITKIKGIKSAGTDESYVTFRLGGKKYTARNNGFAELLIAHGDSISEKKILVGRPPWFEGELAHGRPLPWEPGMDTWELGEGYALTVKSIDIVSNPRKARLVLSKNGVELDDVWLSSENAYRYFQPGETRTPKLITYLDAVFAGASVDAIQLRYTWFVSDNVTQIKKGDWLGVFNVTVMEPDRRELKNREPIELKAGSSVNLFGNLSFFVENSDELRFYPTNMVIPDEVTENSVSNPSDLTTPVMITPFVTNPGRTENTPGFEVVLSITTILAVYIAGRKMK
ncbi:S-layer protein [uncultured archaeon]|nr:S-layer protein [uncultured archaeon]